jgi:hypothetical protein
MVESFGNSGIKIKETEPRVFIVQISVPYSVQYGRVLCNQLD